MSATQYATIQHSLPFVLQPPPPELIFEDNNTAAIREDKKLVYYDNVYNFELETNLTTELKNIIMDKLDDSTYVHLKEMYIGYKGRSVWEFINHLLITYGEKTDDVVKTNLAALNDEFDCTGASIEQLYIHQDELQNFAIGTTGAITDELWVLQTTAVIENMGIMNKAVLKWQAQTTVYKTKAQFINNFNKAHKEYLSLLKLTTTTSIAHNVQQTIDELGPLRSLMIVQNQAIKKIRERVNILRDEACVLTSRTIPATVTTQPMIALQQEVATLRTALAVSEARSIPNNNPNPPG